jgi:subtilase family serine protease
VSNITAGKQQGQTIRLIATIKNQGQSNAGNSKTGFYLDGNTQPLGRVDTPPVSNGYSVTATFDWNTGSVKGTHTIRAKADDTNVVAESDETNNNNSIQVTVK